MLNRLLEILRSGGTYRVDDLAQALNTTPELVEMMLEDLGRKGVLKRVQTSCNGACAACPLAGSCAVSNKSELVWTLQAHS